MNWERLRERVLEENYPSDEEFQRIDSLYSKISSFISEEFNLETHFAGSAGRKTCMTDDRDIDIFVLFPEDIERRQLEEKGLRVGKKTFENFNANHRVEYAEHPYTKGVIEGVEVEIVPCYSTDSEDIKSAVDRTPHHSQWVRKNLDDEQKKEVVIFKKFLKTQNLYGSSLKVRGFSGYLCEILIYIYGSFKSVIENAESWSEKKILDPADHHNGDLPKKLEEKFSDTNLVVIDPVDLERNVSSVLSSQNYSRFIYSAWQFNHNPGINFFQESEKEFEQFELEQEIKNRYDFLVLEFENPDEVDDVVYPQMRKTLRRLKSVLEKHDFRLYESGFHIGDKTRIFFELGQQLPYIQEVKGPKVFHGADHLEQFTSKYDTTYIKEDRLVAKTEREYTDARELLKDFVEKDREKLVENGIPNYVAEKMEASVFRHPIIEDDKWLNYLAERLHVIDK